MALDLVSLERRGMDSIPIGFSNRYGAKKCSSRWYVLHMPKCREVALCDKLKSLVRSSLLVDAFPLRKERWMKRGGAWSVAPVVAYSGYGFAVSPDISGLEKVLSELTLPIELVGAEGRSAVSISDGAADWYDRMMDSRHVIRSSTAEIVDGVLNNIEGPLVGEEKSVIKIDRHRRRCLVSVDDGAIIECCPLDIPFKS